MPRRKNFTPRVTIREKDGKTYLRHRDPFTGKEELRLVKGQYQSQWEREAGTWEAELQDAESRRKAAKLQAAAAIANLPWADFRKRFNDEHLMSLADKTDSRYQTVFNSVEEFETPKYLADIDASYLSRFQAWLRPGRAADTVATTLNHLKVALNWAKRIEILAEVPKFPKVSRAKRGQRRKPMKGRPLTETEFDQMIAQLPQAVPSKAVPAWTRFLKGLWLGGLRLEEGLELWWDRLDKMRVDLESRKHPVLVILWHTEKGKKDRVYPIAPEFAELLRQTPRAKRKGLVFPLKTRGWHGLDPGRSPGQVGVNYASQRITKLGELAGIVTHVDPNGKKHFAGAHDLRRTFGTRWAHRVKALVLKEMMRHEDIKTTEDYYVEMDAEETGDEIWSAWNSVPKGKKAAATRKTSSRNKNPKKIVSGE